MAEVTESAVKRLLASGKHASATRLLDDAETKRLADTLASVTATAELLARVRVRERQQRAIGAKGLHKHGDDQPFFVFGGQPIAPLPPSEALAYFRGLVPELGVDPKIFGPLHQRAAFTLAAATDDVLLRKVKAAITGQLATGTNATPDVQSILDSAGVSPRNPQYADMVTRTNAMDAYNTGAMKELQHPDVRDTFPVWKYLGIDDGRQGEDHEPHFDQYYPNSAAFAEVRGERVFNCRCTMAPVDRFEWAELQAKGAAVDPEWAGGMPAFVSPSVSVPAPLPPVVPTPTPVEIAANPPPSTNYTLPMPPALAAQTKAVAPNGEPVTVYQGSRRKFTGGLQLPADEPGLFLTEDRRVAEPYSLDENGVKTGGVLAAKIHAVTPLDATKSIPPDVAERIAAAFDKHGLSKNAKELRDLVAAGDTDPNRYFVALAGGVNDPAEMRQAFAEAGIDAIKHTDYDVPLSQPDGTEAYATNWLVFDPKNIYAAKRGGKK